MLKAFDYSNAGAQIIAPVFKVTTQALVFLIETNRFSRYRIMLIIAIIFIFQLQIGRLLPSEEYQERIVPCLVKLFESSDRNARYKLLCQIESFVQHLSNKVSS